MILFAMPGLTLVAVYVAAAIGPALFLMRYIYRNDRVEKEPVSLLISLIFMGILAALVSGPLEAVSQAVLPIFFDPQGPYYAVWLAFLGVALIEEGAKYFFLYRRTWRSPNFNCMFGGIVYSAFVSLGFAAFENILYVFEYGLSVALPRAILAIPGHLGFSVFMGVFYGRAKAQARWDSPARSRKSRRIGVGIAVVLHGVYDACCMMSTALSTAIFVVFVIAMYLIVIRTIRRESRNDRPI